MGINLKLNPTLNLGMVLTHSFRMLVFPFRFFSLVLAYCSSLKSEKVSLSLLWPPPGFFAKIVTSPPNALQEQLISISDRLTFLTLSFLKEGVMLLPLSSRVIDMLFFEFSNVLVLFIVDVNVLLIRAPI